MPGWISARLIGYAAVALAVALVLHTWQQRAAQLTAATGALATCTALYDDLSALAEQQNTAIADYRDKADAQQQAADAAQAQARAQIEQSQRRLQRILTAPVPADCPAAVAWTREQAEGIGARWARGAP